MTDSQTQLTLLRAQRDATEDLVLRAALDAAIAALEATVPPPTTPNQQIDNIASNRRGTALAPHCRMAICWCGAVVWLRGLFAPVNQCCAPAAVACRVIFTAAIDTPTYINYAEAY
jgi:hypothetical protein